MSSGTALSKNEAQFLSAALDKTRVRGIITTHVTKSENLDSILANGLRPSRFDNRVFSYPTVANSSTLKSAIIGVPKDLSSVIYFQGNSAKLFQRHPVYGLITADKNIKGIEVTASNHVVKIEEFQRFGKDVVVTKASLEKVSANALSKAKEIAHKSFDRLIVPSASMYLALKVDSEKDTK